MLERKLRKTDTHTLKGNLPFEHQRSAPVCFTGSEVLSTQRAVERLYLLSDVSSALGLPRARVLTWIPHGLPP